MKINRKIILFTYDFPLGDSENTFLKFEVDNLIKNFKEVEIVPQINNYTNLKTTNKFKLNLNLSKSINIINIIFYGIFFTLLSKQFYSEFSRILFKEKFLRKLKMIFSEITKSEIAYRWIKKNVSYNSEDTILYSFWSNFILLSFEKLKKDKFKTSNISRVLGSDLNGYIENDDFVPCLNKKFYSLDKVFVLGNFQKKKLIAKNLISKKKIIICPLGVFRQKNNKTHLKKKIIFLSCGHFIKIKNTLMIINFLKKFANKINKKIIYFIIGNGEEKKKIITSLNSDKNLLTFKLIDKVENLIDFIKQKKINFFLNFSSKEGMSFSIMEAMSCGIPIISSNIDANNSLVKKNTGYLINLENFNQSSSIVIEKIINDINSKKNYYKKCKNSKNFIDKNLINYNCYQKFRKKIKSI